MRNLLALKLIETIMGQFDFNGGAGTLTLNGVGAYLGLPKAWNGGELGSPDEAPEDKVVLT